MSKVKRIVLDGETYVLCEEVEMWTAHEVACLLAEVTGTDCACDVNGNDEWLPSVCDFAKTACPNVCGVACWEQWLTHRKERTNE